MKFTPITPNYKEFDSADEFRAGLGVNTRNRSAASKCHIVTANGKGRRPTSIGAREGDDSDSEVEPTDNHDKIADREDEYRFSALSTSSGSSNTNTSPITTDAPGGSSTESNSSSALARNRIARRFEVSSASGSVVGRRCACCRRYDMHLRSHDDCVAWHTRSHGYTPARSARLGHATETTHNIYAHSYTPPATEIHLISLPEYPAAPLDCERSSPRKSGLLVLTCAVVAACFLLLLVLVPRTLHNLGKRQNQWGPQQQSSSIGAAFNHLLPLHGMDSSQDALNQSLKYQIFNRSDLEQSLAGEESQRAAPVESEEAQWQGDEGNDNDDHASAALNGDTVSETKELPEDAIEIARAEEISLLAGNVQSDSIFSIHNESSSNTPSAPQSRNISITTELFNSGGFSTAPGDSSHYFAWGEGFYCGLWSYQYEQPLSVLPPRSPLPTCRPLNETKSAVGKCPKPSAHLSGATISKSVRKIIHSRSRKIQKLATVHISFVETINRTASSSSHDSISRDDSFARKGLEVLEVLDYAVFPRGGQVIPPQTIRSAMDGEYLTSAEYETSRPVRGKFQLPFKIGSVIQTVGTAAGRWVASAGKALLSYEHVVSHLPTNRFSKLCLAGDAGGRLTILLHSSVIATDLVVESVIPTSHLNAILRKNDQTSASIPALRKEQSGGVGSGWHRAEPSSADDAIFSATVEKIRVYGWAKDPRRWFPHMDSSLQPFHLGDFHFSVDKAAVANKTIYGDDAALVLHQAFPLPTVDASSGEHIPPLRAITLTVLSNYGNRNCTCFFKIKVFGVLF